MTDEDKKIIVVKRTGEEVPYDSKKIILAIGGANKDADDEMADTDVMSVALQVDVKLKGKEKVTVETIQNLIEDTLMLNKFTETARQYIRYRHLHEQKRAASQHLMESYNDLLFTSAGDMDLKRDNANINGDAPMGIMLKLGAEGAKTYADNFVIPDKFAKADKDNFIHIHDKDFSLITFNCLQQDIAKTLKDGFSTGHGFLREPNSIRAAASLACIAVQSSQNDMFGGQSLNVFDFAMAPYVKKSFQQALKKRWHDTLYGYFLGIENDLSPEWWDKAIEALPECEFTEKDNITNYLKSIRYICRQDLWKPFCASYKFACRDTVEETHQAMEALIHNFNTLHSRAGRMCARGYRNVSVKLR